MAMMITDLSFIHYVIKDWVYSLAIGFFVVSYWRGTWTLLDIWCCGQPDDASLADGTTFCFMVPAADDPDGHEATVRLESARLTYGVGIAFLFVGTALLWAGAWMPPKRAATGVITPAVAVARFFIVYILGASAVCIWRGIWYWADVWVLPNTPLASYWTTSLVGSTVAFCLCAGNSLLAPPAIFLIDGPGAAEPPIAVTLLSTYYSVTLAYDEKPPSPPIYVHILDVLLSFIGLPFMVVWFWRGSWLVLDVYLWGLTADRHDIHVSLGWSTLLFFLCLTLTSEPVVSLVDRRITHAGLLGLLGRLRTWILAWGAVNFWRVVWYIWDEFLLGPSNASAWISHASAVACLTAMGCVSSINAPASTLGVDAVPNPKCADEPLFSMIPIPFELLHFLGIARQPQPVRVEKEETKKADEKEEKEIAPAELEEIKKEEEKGEEEITPEVEMTSKEPLSIRSWRPGLGERTKSFWDLQRPGERCWTEHAQRPSLENFRSRSKFFRCR